MCQRARGVTPCMQGHWLALVLAAVCSYVAAGGSSSIPYEAQVASPQQLLAQLMNASVNAIHILGDMDLASGFMEWEALPGDVVLTRNVSLYGSVGQYPALNFGWWKRADGQLVAHGLRLGPGVVLVVAHVVLKQASTNIPEFVFGADATSTVVLYDCIKHLYVGISPVYAWGPFASGTRPPQAPPGNNTAVYLPDGFCRPAPAPALCWPLAYYLVDVAQAITILPLSTTGNSTVLTVIYGVATVVEQVVGDACLQQFYASRPQCVNDATARLQAQEAASPSGWLQPPATPAQLAAAQQGLLAAPSLPIPAYVPPWLLDSQAPSPGAGGVSSASSPPPTDADAAANFSKKEIAGMAVGLGVGIPMVLAAAAVPMWCVTRRRRAALYDAQHQDKDADDSTATAHDGSTAAESSTSNQQHGLQAAGDAPLRQAAVSVPVVHSKSHATSEGGMPANLTGPQRSHDHSPLDPITAVITPHSPVQPDVNLQVDLDKDIVLGDMIGSGGYGTVYRALYRGQQVAVKVFTQGVRPISIEQEVGILARTHHPNVVSLLGACTGTQRLALVEELCDGSLEQLMYAPTLTSEQLCDMKDGDVRLVVCQGSTADTQDMCGSSISQPGPGGPARQQSGSCAQEEAASRLPQVPRPLPLPLVLSIALDVAAGLAYLHPTIIHRDLKPANILLVARPPTTTSMGSCSHGPTTAYSIADSSSQGHMDATSMLYPNDSSTLPDLTAKLSDFGVSRMRDAITIVTQRPYCGTVPYLAPECFKRQQAGLTHKCDIYSFGIVLWELLHGQQPWSGYSPAEVLYEVVVGHNRPPITVPDDRCPRTLRKLLQLCWDPDPHRRPSALEIARELVLLQRQLGVNHPLQR